MEGSTARLAARIDGSDSRRGSTQRTHSLAQDAVNRSYKPFAEQRRLHRQFSPPSGISPILQEAHRFAYVHSQLTPVIRSGELIVGARVRSGEDGEAGHWFPDGNPSYIDAYAANAPRHEDEIVRECQRGLISPQGSFNHKVVDYAGFLRMGSKALIDEANARAKAETGKACETALAFAMGHQAIIEHSLRYSEACAAQSSTASGERRQELLELARICRKVPAEPAETFHEALQSLWFAYMVAGDGLGRIDMYLEEFYERDLAAGRLDCERAQELIECLLIKLHGDYLEGTFNVSAVHTLTLGGLLPDGSDGTNTLTRLFLQAVWKVRLLRPSIYLRIHDDTPQDVLDTAVRMVGDGVGEPQFFSDVPVLRGLRRLGVSDEQAHDYALSGCAEVVLPGIANWGAPNGWINLALLVDDALRRAARAEISANSDAGIWKAVQQSAERVAEMCRVCNEWVDMVNVDPRLQATLFMPCCLRNGADVAHGGADTYMGHWEAVGLPNAADMLAAARILPGELGLSLDEVYAKLDAQDEQVIRAAQRVSKFGNDCPETDHIAGRLINMMASALERRRTKLRSVLTLGHLAGGENMHIAYGLRMGPTLDGRRSGEPLADSLAGAQGVVNQGPTALVRSLSRIDHSKLIAGSVCTLRLNRQDFATPDNRRRVIGLIRAYVHLGGGQLQLNVVDAEELRKAQAAPEEYRGLIVRVAGYSADFTHLGKTLQDEIISRSSAGTA